MYRYVSCYMYIPYMYICMHMSTTLIKVSGRIFCREQVQQSTQSYIRTGDVRLTTVASLKGVGNMCLVLCVHAMGVLLILRNFCFTMKFTWSMIVVKRVAFH